MIESRIKLAQEIIAENEKNIEAQRGDVETQKREILKLSVLQKRLQKIHSVKYLENLGSIACIAQLANEKRTIDFVQDLGLLVDIKNPGISELPLLQLTLWQMIYLLYGDLTELDKKLNRAEAAELNEDIQDAPAV